MMTLLDIVEKWISGDWGKESPCEDAQNQICCIRGADIVPIANVDFKDIPIRFVSDRSLANRSLREGDIVIEKSGGSPTQSTGRSAFVSKELMEARGPILCSNFCCAFRVRSGWNPKYIYYYLQYFCGLGTFFNFEGKTSGLKNLDVENAFTAIVAPSASKDVQDKVEGLLSSIDHRIALNRKCIATLEAMAKEIYDYWFVQFDFPDANGRPYKSSVGAMVYNPDLKREIPKGWEVKPLAEAVKELNSGEWGTDACSEISSVAVHCLRGADMEDQSNLPARYISERKTDKLLSVGDIVIEMSGGSPTQATGRSCYVSQGLLDAYNGKLTCTNFCNSLKLKEMDETAYFLFVWRMFYQAGLMFNFEGKTSGLKNLQIDSLLATKWVFPPKELEAKFNKLHLSVTAQTDNCKKEISRLSALRDFLLPVLMNGQVEVV